VTSKLKFAEDNLKNLISKNKYTEEHLANFKDNLHVAKSIDSLSENRHHMKLWLRDLTLSLKFFHNYRKLQIRS